MTSGYIITVTNYLWDELSAYGDVVLEANGSNQPQTSYVLGNGELLSQYTDSNSTLGYFLADGQGSTRLLTNSSGGVLSVSGSNQQFSYDAYGNLQTRPTTPGTNYLYTGQQFDPLTSLYDLRARYYNPNDARFLSRDTTSCSCNLTKPFELNRYAYSVNNPINAYDPLGHAAVAEEAEVEVSDLGVLSGETQAPIGTGKAATTVAWIAVGVVLVLATTVAIITNLHAPQPNNPSSTPTNGSGASSNPQSGTGSGGGNNAGGGFNSADCRDALNKVEKALTNAGFTRLDLNALGDKIGWCDIRRKPDGTIYDRQQNHPNLTPSYLKGIGFTRELAEAFRELYECNSKTPIILAHLVEKF